MNESDKKVTLPEPEPEQENIMGQYFRFVNKATKEISHTPIGNRQGASYSVNLHINNRERSIDIFKQVANSNQWELSDVIAVGDYGNLVWLDNDIVNHGYIVDTLLTDYKDLYTSIWEN